MYELLVALGILTFIFFLLASTNALTAYSKHTAVLWIASKHKIFGMLATITAITHMIIAIINDSFRLTGLLTVIALVLTGLFGMLFYKLKKKSLYIAHRVMGPITLVLIIIHVVTNLI